MSVILLALFSLSIHGSLSIKVIESREGSDTGRAKIKDVKLQVS